MRIEMQIVIYLLTNNVNKYDFIKLLQALINKVTKKYFNARWSSLYIQYQLNTAKYKVIESQCDCLYINEPL